MKTIQSLKITTLIYLLIPSVLFLLTWVHLRIGIPCVLFLIFYLWKTHQSTFEENTEIRISSSLIWMCLGLSILINFLLGIGEFRPQTYDFQANNYKYYDLITHDLPVYYAQQKTYLCYYTGYYLPTALLAKVFGIESARYFSFIWSVLGLWIILLWIASFQQKKPLFLILFVILFPNAWVVIKVMMEFKLFQEYLQPYYFQINHFKLINETLIKNYAWATQHTIPACLGACVLINIFKEKDTFKDLKYALILLLSTMFWSPLTAIGLFPFVGFLFLKNAQKLFQQEKWSDLGLMIILIISFSPLLLYFISTEGIHANNTEFIWQTGVTQWWILYVIYVFFNFELWGILLSFYKNPNKIIWIIAVILPCLVALYRIGIYNDFNIRVAFPSFFFLSILVGISFIEKMKIKPVVSLVIMAFVVLGSIANINQLYKGIHQAKLLTTIEKPFIFKANNMLEFQRVAYGDEEAILEYSLKKNSIFERYFLKKYHKL
jgi:MFS family permease